MTDDPDETVPENKTPRDKATLLVQMSKEAKRIERRLGAKACIVICMFEDGNLITVQDAGLFPMPPEQFYGIMQAAHESGQLNDPAAKVKKSRILRPN